FPHSHSASQGMGDCELEVLVDESSNEGIDSSRYKTHCYIVNAVVIITFMAILVMVVNLLLRQCPSFPKIFPEQKRCVPNLPTHFHLKNIDEVNISGQMMEFNGCYFQGGKSVQSFSLEGSFTPNQLRKLLQILPNLHTLKLYSSRFQTIHLHRKLNDRIEHSKLRKLVIVNQADQDWNSIYNFLSDNTSFQFGSIELENIVIVVENERSIGKFLLQQSRAVQHLSFRNSTFARNTHLFASLSFPKLRKAEIELNNRFAALAPDNFLKVFSAATPKLKDFSSNIRLNRTDYECPPRFSNN
ncbi:unnamed protein product, partial [Allacma fusca]